MDDAIKKAISEKLTISVDEAAKAFNIGKNACYRAVDAGDIPSFRVGGKICVPTAPLRKMLGIEAA